MTSHNFFFGKSHKIRDVIYGRSLYLFFIWPPKLSLEVIFIGSINLTVAILCLIPSQCARSLDLWLGRPIIKGNFVF